MTECDLATSVSDWVIEHPAALPVFRRLGIDYSCAGKSLEYACRQRGLDPESVLAQLRATGEEGGDGPSTHGGDR